MADPEGRFQRTPGIVDRHWFMHISVKKSQKTIFRVASVSEWYQPVYSGVAIRMQRFNTRMLKKGLILPIVITKKVSGAKSFEKLAGMAVERVNIILDILPKSDGIKEYLRKLYLLLYLMECSIKLYLRLRKKRNHFDILHAYALSWFSLLSLPIAHGLGKTALIEVTLDGGMLDNLKGGAVNPVEVVRRWALGKADRVLTHSPYMSELVKSAGVPDREIVMIPNPVDVEEYCPVDRKAKWEVRQKLGMGREDRILLYVGGINKRKAVDFILESFIFLKQPNDNLKLYLVGPTDKYDQEFIRRLESRIFETGFSYDVCFSKGSVTNVSEYMKASDIFLFASRNEGFGTVVVEAMSCGMPVVVRNIPLVTEYQITNGMDGIVLFEPTVEEYARSIGMLINDEAYRFMIGRKAREKVLKQFSADRIDDAYAKIYDEVMSNY